jgi:hypothetical protein
VYRFSGNAKEGIERVLIRVGGGWKCVEKTFGACDVNAGKTTF